MHSFGNSLWLFILSIVIAIFSANPQSAPIIPNLTLQDVIGTLGGMFTIVLLVERATEIALTIWQSEGTDQKQKRLSSLESSDVQDEKEIAKVKKELEKFQRETKKTALRIGFTFAVIVCSSGVGLLGEIIDMPAANQSLIRGIDIILTSGLIAGGSDSFHQFVRVLETFAIKSKENFQSSSSPKAESE